MGKEHRGVPTGNEWATLRGAPLVTHATPAKHVLATCDNMFTQIVIVGYNRLGEAHVFIAREMFPRQVHACQMTCGEAVVSSYGSLHDE